MVRRLVLLGTVAVLAFLPLTTSAATAWNCVRDGGTDSQGNQAWICSDEYGQVYVVCPPNGGVCTYYRW